MTLWHIAAFIAGFIAGGLFMRWFLMLGMVGMFEKGMLRAGEPEKWK